MENRRFSIKRIVLVTIGALVAGGAGYAGYMAGRLTTGYDWQVHMRSESTGLLIQRIDLLAELRAGKTEEMIRRLQNSIDNLVLMSACPPGGFRDIDDFDPEKLPTAQLTALRLARAYTDAAPETPLSEQSQQFLGQVEPPDTKYCSAALRAFLRTLPESASTKKE